ncbi:MAG: prepilin-type N-terminal cleavage/methylation domain-containing protein [Candidatus Omnitrophica bacterium]|nr:prepilin-type N-terminal cleavage/methylation domain-containing protein [Candidatus Omnitrophota bacterium]
MKKNKTKAFTLIELLIAVTIFSIASSVIYSSFRLGVLSWKRSEDVLKKYQKIRYAVNLLSEDIAGTFIFKDIQFKGDEARIEFPGLVECAAAGAKTVGRISYEFSQSSGRLLRLKQSYREALNTASTGGEELLSDVIDFKISYCYKLPDSEEPGWLGEWFVEEKIPAGVKMELVVKDNYSPDGKMIFVKRINIPTGEMLGMEELKNESEK